MMDHVSLANRSEEEKVAFMDRVAWYIRYWDCDDWYEVECDGTRCEPYFTFSEYCARWKCNLFKCFDNGCLWFEADAGIGACYEISMKIIADYSMYRIMCFTNVFEPYLFGVAPDLYSAMYYCICELEHVCGKEFILHRAGSWTVLEDPTEKPFFQKQWKCSCCGETNTYGPTRYCPLCGALMEDPADGK